ncbi:hypothetical protein OV450_3131 [Actinobacteria bacterium OV450]|nr:hypothetical protein OV450_3131 [Actinobacteria bacterium OV450]
MAADHDYSDLTAVHVNCTLKRSPETSYTEGLIERSRAVMEAAGTNRSGACAVAEAPSPGTYRGRRVLSSASRS